MCYIDYASAFEEREEGQKQKQKVKRGREESEADPNSNSNSPTWLQSTWVIEIGKANQIGAR